MQALLLVINGMSVGSVLFVVATGLSLVLGLMRIINLAHGTLYVAAGLIALHLANRVGGGFIGACGLAILMGSVVGAGLWLVISPLIGRQLEQVLATLGINFVIVNAILWTLGPFPQSAIIPGALKGTVKLGHAYYPLYRLMVIAISLGIGLGLWTVVHRSRLGAMIRAGMEDPDMAEALGINLRPIMAGSFLLASGFTGFSAVLGTMVFGDLAYYDALYILMLSVTVIILGGVGSVEGAFLGSLILGILDSLVKVYVPFVAPFLIYLLVAATLAFRPYGILGKHRREV